MDFVFPATDPRALQQILFRVGIAGCRDQRGKHIFVCTNVVDDRAGLDHTGPADHGRHAEASLPLGGLFAGEHRRTAIWPGENFRAVIGGIHDDCVLGNA